MTPVKGYLGHWKDPVNLPAESLSSYHLTPIEVDRDEIDARTEAVRCGCCDEEMTVRVLSAEAMVRAGNRRRSLGAGAVGLGLFAALGVVVKAQWLFLAAGAGALFLGAGLLRAVLEAGQANEDGLELVVARDDMSHRLFSEREIQAGHVDGLP